MSRSQLAAGLGSKSDPCTFSATFTPSLSYPTHLWPWIFTPTPGLRWDSSWNLRVGFVQRRGGYSGQGNSQSKGMEAGMERVCMEAIKEVAGGSTGLGMVGWG